MDIVYCFNCGAKVPESKAVHIGVDDDGDRAVDLWMCDGCDSVMGDYALIHADHFTKGEPDVVEPICSDCGSSQWDCIDETHHDDLDHEGFGSYIIEAVFRCKDCGKVYGTTNELT